MSLGLLPPGDIKGQHIDTRKEQSWESLGTNL